jgi:hypothetical protein
MNNRSKNVAKTKQKQSQSKAKGKIHAESNKSPEYTTIYHSASQRTTVYHSASQRTTVHRSASERIRAYLSKFNYIQELSCVTFNVTHAPVSNGLPVLVFYLDAL